MSLQLRERLAILWSQLCFQSKSRVTVAPEPSAERAAANAPIIINRNSQLFKNYQQQRLPRRAIASAQNPQKKSQSSQNPHKKRGIFREDILSITPKPHNSSPILYKPSTTPAPEITNEIVEPATELTNEIVEELPPAQYFQQIQDEKVEFLEEERLNSQYEALKLPNYTYKLMKRDEMSNAKNEPSWSILGTFLRNSTQNNKWWKAFLQGKQIDLSNFLPKLSIYT